MGQDKFSQRLLGWFEQHGRHDLPWQLDPTPYRVWVSEIMLQQTQVTTVIPYYQRFMQSFPEVQSLAGADLDLVLHHWAGLGYYARGRNLHKTAQIIVEEHACVFPEEIQQVIALPGIGRSTAGAILALAKGQRHSILDGNVKRCLCRYHGVKGYPGAKKVESLLWELAEKHTPADRTADYTQAIMDMGATLCTRSKPKCEACPQQSDCYANLKKRTAELPYPRPKRTRPDKHRYMLVLLGTNRQVALFKRPASGIWGGLYSLPEFESRQACSEQLRRYDVNDVETLKTGEVIDHVFSHFKLRITPLILPVSEKQLERILNASRLIPISENTQELTENTVYHLHPDAEQSGIGIPAPIQKILDRL